MNKDKLRGMVAELFPKDKISYSAEEYTRIIDTIFQAKWYELATNEKGEDVLQRKTPTTLEMIEDIDRKREVISLFSDINVMFYAANNPSTTDPCIGYGKEIKSKMKQIKALLLEMVGNEEKPSENELEISEFMQWVFKDNAQDFISEAKRRKSHGKQLRALYEHYKNEGKAEETTLITLYEEFKRMGLNAGTSYNTFKS